MNYECVFPCRRFLSKRRIHNSQFIILNSNDPVLASQTGMIDLSVEHSYKNHLRLC